jgi:hypothetical protein
LLQQPIMVSFDNSIDLMILIERQRATPVA